MTQLLKFEKTIHCLSPLNGLVFLFFNNYVIWASSLVIPKYNLVKFGNIQDMKVEILSTQVSYWRQLW